MRFADFIYWMILSIILLDNYQSSNKDYNISMFNFFKEYLKNGTRDNNDKNAFNTIHLKLLRNIHNN